MADENPGGTSADAALDMAVGTAIATAVVTEDVAKPVDLAALPPNCLNCGALVRGRYCVDCGQTTDTHVPTMTEIVGDAIASIFNLDSRLWRTVTALFFKPGMLTREFLAGRRARYVPPLRLYLVLSVLTFLVLSFPDGDEDDSVEGNPLTPEQQAAIQDAPSEAARAAAIDEAVDAQLAAALENVPAVPGDPDPNLDISTTDDGVLTLADGAGARIQIDNDFECDEMDIPGFPRGSAVDTAVREACDQGKADNFDSLKDAFQENIPLLTFMVIPVMAVVLKLFYAFSRRNYLEHLVFLCHTHAFTFLIFIVLTAMRYAGKAVPALSSSMTALGAAMLLLYPPIYYFLAMRRVYAQGVMLTLLKQVVLMIVYLFVVMLVFAVGFVVLMLVT
jgi:hypothetical protein